MSTLIRRGFGTHPASALARRPSAPLRRRAAKPTRAGLKAAQARQRGWNGPPSRTGRNAAGTRSATASKSPRRASNARKGKGKSADFSDDWLDSDADSPDEGGDRVEADGGHGDADDGRHGHDHRDDGDDDHPNAAVADAGAVRSGGARADFGTRRPNALGQLGGALTDAIRSAQANDAAGLQRAIFRLDDVMQADDAHRLTPVIAIDALRRHGRRVANPSQAVAQLLAVLPLKVLQLFAPRSEQQLAERACRTQLPYYRNAHATRRP
jgi:hypothetical protein